MAKTKPLSAQTIEALKADLVNRDYQFASRLHNLQDEQFPRKLKNIGEWSEAEKIKRLILGLHDNKSSVEVDGLHDFPERLARAISRVKNGKG